MYIMKCKMETSHKMWINQIVIVVLVFLIKFVCISKAYKYKTILEDDEIFSKCENEPPSVLDINGLFNMTDITLKSDFDKVTVSGNATLAWDIQLKDRIEVDVKLWKYDHGSWQPTLYGLKMANACPVMYDKNQYWYKSWLKYVTNINEVKGKCFNVPGTKFIHSVPFDLVFTLDSHIMDFSGHYKVKTSLKAFDELNKIRPTSICLVIKMEFSRT